MTANITNVFVLMLENRSFDHMLGFSGLTGTDAATGKATSLDGLTGAESNIFDNVTYDVSSPADFAMPVDPGHEFPDVLEQLAGVGAKYPSGGAYPPITNAGFVASYANGKGAAAAPGEIMKGYTAAQLPVLNALARAFAVCDHWHSSLPGPTWPNRFFAVAASSGGLDHSPSTSQMIEWESVDGFSFPNGSIFQALGKRLSFGWRIFSQDEFPVCGALKGITLPDIGSYDAFLQAVAMPEYPWAFTFIEPNYGDIENGSYRGGTSEHPMDDVRHGEALIKSTYEAIRNSPHWNTSLLLVLWDEHGGFYDHVAPPAAVAPGDTAPGSKYNQYGFTFERYGVRVPALVISPLIPANVIDHRLYDHTSMLASVEQLFGVPPLTKRDAQATSVLSLLSLATPRTDAPTTLPNPASAMPAPAPAPPSPPSASVDSGNLPGFLHVAMRHDMQLSPPAEHPAIVARVQSIQTRPQAAQYIGEVRGKVRAERSARSPAR